MQYKESIEHAYKGKRIFLTGHTGFKGSWLLVWLNQLGAIIRGYALASENKDDLYHLIKGNKLCDSVIGDIRDKNKLYESILDFKPDFIFHLAAQPLVRLSYEMPLYTYEVNVNGTIHILEAVRALQKPCSVIIITTDKVYENKEIDYAYKETDKMGGYDPYSASKAVVELVVDSYRNSFFNLIDIDKHGKAVASARAGNVIGGGDMAIDRIIPDIIRALQVDEPVQVRNPGAIRPWQHVLEPLSGYLLLGAKLAENPDLYADAWNFGPLQIDVLTVEDLVKYVIQFFGKGKYILRNINGQPHEAGLLKLDINKTMQILQWKPAMNSVEAIQQTIYWYKEATPANALELIRQQIISYQRLIT